MKRSVLEKINLDLMFTGYPPWGFTLHKLLKKLCPRTTLFENEHLTFHLGDDRIWKKSKTNKLREKIKQSPRSFFRKLFCKKFKK